MTVPSFKNTPHFRSESVVVKDPCTGTSHKGQEGRGAERQCPRGLQVPWVSSIGEARDGKIGKKATRRTTRVATKIAHGPRGQGARRPANVSCAEFGEDDVREVVG